MTERMDEILGSTLYNLYCPCCSLRESVMLPDPIADGAGALAVCRECGLSLPLVRREDHTC